MWVFPTVSDKLNRLYRCNHTEYEVMDWYNKPKLTDLGQKLKKGLEDLN